MEKKENLKNETIDSSKTNDSSIFNPSKKKILELSDTLKISRNLNTKIYYIENYSFGNKTYDHIFCKDIVLHLPYILYFDDFRDSMEEEVEIIKDEKGKYFGDELTQQHFRQYSYPNKILKKVTLEDLIIAKDILTIKEHLNLDQNVKIKKVISHLYYSKNKESILKTISHETLENINHNLGQLIRK